MTTPAPSAWCATARCWCTARTSRPGRGRLVDPVLDARRLRFPRPCQADRGGDPFTGCIGFDYRRPDDGLVMIEANPRASAGAFFVPGAWLAEAISGSSPELRTVPAGLSRQYDAYLLDPHIRLGPAGAGPARAPDHARCLLRAARRPPRLSPSGAATGTTWRDRSTSGRHGVRRGHVLGRLPMPEPPRPEPSGASRYPTAATEPPRSLFSGVNLLATNVAPCASARTVIRTQGASNGDIPPPSSVALAAAASASATAKVSSTAPACRAGRPGSD